MTLDYVTRAAPCRSRSPPTSSTRCSAPSGSEARHDANGWLQILVFFAASILALTRPLGVYMHRVFEGERQPLPRVLGPHRARPATGSAASTRDREQTWMQYTVALLAVQRLRRAGDLRASSGCSTCCRSTRSTSARSRRDSAFNTAASFTTNTNWQAYGGESTMSYLTQMAGLAWHNFTSAAAGHRRGAGDGARAHAAARGRRRADARQLLGRSDPRASSTCSCPSASSSALVLVSQGVHPEPRRLPRASPRSRAPSRPSRWGRSPRRRRSRSSAPTAAASSTPTAPTRSRTRRRSPTSSQMVLHLRHPGRR